MTRLTEELRDKRYREAFVGSEINIGIPFQVRALREKRGWTQQVLAQFTGMKQPRISAIEQPGKSTLNLETLRRLAAAFDCGLIVRFAPFSELVRWAQKFNPDKFDVPTFDNDFIPESGLGAVDETNLFYRPAALPSIVEGEVVSEGSTEHLVVPISTHPEHPAFSEWQDHRRESESSMLTLNGTERTFREIAGL